MRQRVLGNAEDRRTDVVAAATSAFAARGYYGTNTTEIAAAAGISQAYLYRLFANKEALFIAVLDAIKTDIRRNLDTAFDAATGNATPTAQRLVQASENIDAESVLLHAIAACGVPAIAAAVRSCYEHQWKHLRDHGVSDSVIREYLASAQLAVAVRNAGFDEDDPVARALRS